MNLAEINRFYKSDKREYEVKNNKKLLSYIHKITNEDYDSFININDLKSLIDDVMVWYEIKYPEREFKCFEYGCGYKDEMQLTKFMNIDQLLYRLPKNESSFLKCYYRTNKKGTKNIYDDNGKIVGYEPISYIQINNKNSNDINNNFLIDINSMTGKVNSNIKLKKIINNYDVSIEELFNILNENYSERLEFSEIKRCIYNHECDINLRNELLQLISLKLLYSKNTTPIGGYFRAKKLIDEFNDKFNLNLDMSKLDEIMKEFYSDKDIKYIDSLSDEIGYKKKI